MNREIIYYNIINKKILNFYKKSLIPVIKIWHYMIYERIIYLSMSNITGCIFIQKKDEISYSTLVVLYSKCVNSLDYRDILIFVNLSSIYLSLIYLSLTCIISSPQYVNNDNIVNISLKTLNHPIMPHTYSQTLTSFHISPAYPIISAPHRSPYP